jgi:hypothetical protein
VWCLPREGHFGSFERPGAGSRRARADARDGASDEPDAGPPAPDGKRLEGKVSRRHRDRGDGDDDSAGEDRCPDEALYGAAGAAPRGLRRDREGVRVEIHPNNSVASLGTILREDRTFTGKAEKRSPFNGGTPLPWTRILGERPRTVAPAPRRSTLRRRGRIGFRSRVGSVRREGWAGHQGGLNDLQGAFSEQGRRARLPSRVRPSAVRILKRALSPARGSAVGRTTRKSPLSIARVGPARFRAVCAVGGRVVRSRVSRGIARTPGAR